jgi:hypothetical protein
LPGLTPITIKYEKNDKKFDLNLEDCKSTEEDRKAEDGHIETALKVWTPGMGFQPKKKNSGLE